jgi:hypothetical protein
LQLRRPRQWGACWLALLLWRELQLDQFWCKRLSVSRKGTRWDQVLFVLVVYRLLAPGSEWCLHREWFQRSALADLLGEDAGLAEIHKLYRCHDRLLTYKQAVFDCGVAAEDRPGGSASRRQMVQDGAAQRIAGCNSSLSTSASAIGSKISLPKYRV